MSLTELLAQGFVQRAILAAALLGIGCGILSFFVVQRRLAFMGHGVAHSMVAGVGIGVLLNWPVVWPAVAVAILVSLGVGWITRRGQVSEDSAIGVTLSAALAFGLVLVSLKRGYMMNLEGYLFGSLVAVLPADLYGLGALVLAIAVVALVFWKILLLFAFDPEGAAVAGYPVEAHALRPAAGPGADRRGGDEGCGHSARRRVSCGSCDGRRLLVGTAGARGGTIRRLCARRGAGRNHRRHSP